MLAFVLMLLMAFVVFDVPVKGSSEPSRSELCLRFFLHMRFGQLVSTFTRTQVAAVFATTVLCIIPVVNFPVCSCPCPPSPARAG